MEALVGQKGDLELDPVLDRRPVEGFEDGCDVGGTAAPPPGSWQHNSGCTAAAGCSCWGS